MGLCRIVVLDPQLLAKISECFIIKLLSTIKDKDFRDPKATDNAFPDEASYVLLGDRVQRFCFNLFGEVIVSHEKELELPYCRRKGSYDVESSLGEGPGGVHRSELF